MKWLPIIQTALLAALVILTISQNRQAVVSSGQGIESLKEEVEGLKTVRDSLKDQLREADTILTQIKNEDITSDVADSIISEWERTRLR